MVSLTPVSSLVNPEHASEVLGLVGLVLGKGSSLLGHGDKGESTGAASHAVSGDESILNLDGTGRVGCSGSELGFEGLGTGFLCT